MRLSAIVSQTPYAAFGTDSLFSRFTPNTKTHLPRVAEDVVHFPKIEKTVLSSTQPGEGVRQELPLPVYSTTCKANVQEYLCNIGGLGDAGFGKSASS